MRRTVERPAALPGVTVVRCESVGHLCCVVPDRHGSVFHIAGRSEWSLRGGQWSSRPGTIDLKVPDEVHVERARHGPARFQVALFDPELVEHARAALDRPAAAPEFNAIDGDDPRVRPIAALHRGLLAEESAPALEQALCAALAAFVALTCAPRRTPSTRPAWRAAVARARALLDERITETVALDELAAHARLDKYRLCRAFREELGLPPHAYVTHRRVGLAQQLLARGLSQAEVAVSVGLYDQSQLHRHFKRILGVTPGAYARAVR